MRIYLAEGMHRTLVGRRPPTVRGRCDSLRHGSVTAIRPRPGPGPHPPGFAIPLAVAFWGTWPAYSRNWTRLSAVGRGVPADSPMRAEVAERTDRARTRTERLDGSVTTRLQHLSRLADGTESFVRRQRALAEAREALRSADYLLNTDDAAHLPPDAAADLADHTSAVLAGYQELIS